MIEIIYGAKGSGKTKRIIDAANKSLEKQQGDIVFITDTNRYVHDIKYHIRFANTNEKDIRGEDGLVGFIQGLLEGNYDIRFMFIDGAARIMNKSIGDLGSFFERLATIAEKSETLFCLTISDEKANLPEFIAKYIKE